MSNSEVALIPSDGKTKMINLTRSGYNDSRPVWVNKGKQMLWFSDRDGLRSYANSGNRQADVYSLFFTRDAWDRFRLSKEDYALIKEIEDKAKEKEKKEKEKESADKKKKSPEVKKDTSVVFDMDGHLRPESQADYTFFITRRCSSFKRRGKALLSCQL